MGEVALGASGLCTVVLVNDGTAELELAAATIAESTEPAVFFSSDIAGPLRPGASAALRIAASPATAGPSSATVEVRAIGAEEVLVAIPVSVVGVSPPRCVARVKSINGVAVDGGLAGIAPLDDVILTLSDSTVAAGRTIASFQWSIATRPAQSTVRVASPSTVDTGLTGLDVAGTYTVTATIVDSAGHSDACELEISAIPLSPFVAQLRWETSLSDLDLHMHRLSDELCSPLDCYASTCGDGGVVWGDASQSPQLTADTGGSFGSETITMEAPADGVYRLAIHARSARQSTSATLKVFSDGHLRAELATSIPVDSLWQALEVTCVAGLCITREIGSIEAPGRCGP